MTIDPSFETCIRQRATFDLASRGKIRLKSSRLFAVPILIARGQYGLTITISNLEIADCSRYPNGFNSSGGREIQWCPKSGWSGAIAAHPAPRPNDRITGFEKFAGRLWSARTATAKSASHLVHLPRTAVQAAAALRDASFLHLLTMKDTAATPRVSPRQPKGTLAVPLIFCIAALQRCGRPNHRSTVDRLVSPTAMADSRELAKQTWSSVGTLRTRASCTYQIFP